MRISSCIMILTNDELIVADNICKQALKAKVTDKPGGIEIGKIVEVKLEGNSIIATVEIEKQYEQLFLEQKHMEVSLE